MNNGLFGANELSTIDNERLGYIKQYASYEYKKYTYKFTNPPISVRKVIKTASSNKMCPNTIVIPNTKNNPCQQTLEKYFLYKANTKDFPLNNDVEKIFFMCCGIFPNDDKILNILADHNFLNILDKFIKIYSYIEKKYKDNETLSKMQKYMQYKKLIKVHGNELIKLREYFYKFHCITDISLIINKLLQIYYFNPELYDSYIESNEVEKTNQKVNKKIG